MAQKLLHACIRVHNLEETKKFYMDLFDFTISREKDYPEDKFTLCYLVVPGSDFELELTYNYEADPYTIGNGFSHLALGVDNLKKFIKSVLLQVIIRLNSKACPVQIINISSSPIRMATVWK